MGAAFAAQEQVGCMFRPVGTEDGVPTAGHEYGRLSNGLVGSVLSSQGDGIRLGNALRRDRCDCFPSPSEFSSIIGNGGEIVPVEIVQVSASILGRRPFAYAG